MNTEHGYDGWANGSAHCTCGRTFDSVQALDRHVNPTTETPGGGGLLRVVDVEQMQRALDAARDAGYEQARAEAEKYIGQLERAALKWKGERDDAEKQWHQWEAVARKIRADEDAAMQARAEDRARIEAVLTLHSDDGAGFCRYCGRVNIAGDQRWPCETARAALTATEDRDAT